MKKIEAIIKPFKLDEVKEAPYKNFIKEIEKFLSYEEREKFQSGIVGQGLKSQTYNTLIKDFLYKVIEDFEYIKGDDSKTRLVNSKVKKDLKHHVDYIFDTLLSSDSKPNNEYEETINKAKALINALR